MANLNPLEKQIKRTIEENQRLKTMLFLYGDHTLECYAAKTDKCTCGWEYQRREMHIKPRM